MTQGNVSVKSRFMEKNIGQKTFPLLLRSSVDGAGLCASGVGQFYQDSRYLNGPARFVVSLVDFMKRVVVSEGRFIESNSSTCC